MCQQSLARRIPAFWGQSIRHDSVRTHGLSDHGGDLVYFGLGQTKQAGNPATMGVITIPLQSKLSQIGLSLIELN